MATQPLEKFPRKPRSDGRFQKRILGRLYYFGADGDRPAALREYDRVKYDLYAGRNPRPERDAAQAGISVKQVCNLYIDDLTTGVVSVTEHHRQRAIAILRKFTKHVGAARVVSDLAPDDFTSFGLALKKTAKSGYTFNRYRAYIMACFNHASAQDWIAHAPKFGRGFARIALGKLRSNVKVRFLAAEDLRALLAVAPPWLFAMILLGVNGGFGITDCAALRWDQVDDVLRMRRTKNNIPRSVPLWPETLGAINRLPREGDLVFRTVRGNPFNTTSVAHEFAKIRESAAVQMPTGVGFYALRHTFATMANEVRDTDARRHIMGRKLPNLDDVYVETMFAERLKKVTDHVRDRLSITDIVGHLSKNLSPSPSA